MTMTMSRHDHAAAEVEAPRHLRAAEVGGPGRDDRLAAPLGARLRPLGDEALGQAVGLLAAPQRREDPPAPRLVGLVRLGRVRVAHLAHATDPRPS